MKKQTAVNYVRDEAIKLVAQAMQGILDEDTLENQINQIVTTALQMEKEQIENAYRINPNNEIWSNSGIDYYNETYGGDK
jgi:division protein CdvB (Snf7/Vps24/ESCRT-III family)